MKLLSQTVSKSTQRWPLSSAALIPQVACGDVMPHSTAGFGASRQDTDFRASRSAHSRLFLPFWSWNLPPLTLESLQATAGLIHLERPASLLLPRWERPAASRAALHRTGRISRALPAQHPGWRLVGGRAKFDNRVRRRNLSPAPTFPVRQGSCLTAGLQGLPNPPSQWGRSGAARTSGCEKEAANQAAE